MSECIKTVSSKIELLHASCADQVVDVVVNAANDGLWAGGDKHSVVANRDPEQHRNNSVEEDMKVLNRLLDWWCKPEHRVMSCQIKTSKAGE